ncbi:GDP/UDP-N,N'-diacetylbacillosamine 2-epimerase (hydrolysing) [Planktotalea frisia]|jgi:UDP-hydrolysing UDP-N-acetyl-D-glucosamine 2-epimerase|uniref:UDP-N,N'-diacetylbacillosamine 2-epimerase (Hydrolyzing) n=1 Tax=Planktotalea frisia TaxID=696762 RepID=A0A1L9NTK1_9RHOB|nr:UDP-N-acetylglucosamine 2-epimerase [Planktotalea frisia]OJI92464.1 UDP-N,N'-diacetylbacillosamine 2-epimerase (hydrolyzing) [Planktotalea frisia]PZX23540.1 GDP/UDP-N,N'-diacetylbacillosamine 2-epimerase (hydrolysing) [Planktotalea frisia]
MTRHVHFLTGIRSEYDILAPVIEAVNNMGDLDASVIVTGGHLSTRMGNSISQIEADGFRIAARIDSLLASDGVSGRVKGAALQMAGMTDLFAQERPDFLVVMGDREESMTGALTGLYHHIPVVHIGGGDHAEDGNVDNPIRHAVSKIANLHMATTPLSGQRLRALGEEDWRINVVGASGLDRLVSTPHMDRAGVEAALNLAWQGQPYIVFLYHPTITDFSAARAHMETISNVLEKSGVNVVALMPNTDPGNDAVVAELTALSARCERVKLFTFLERHVFVNMLRHAHAMVGNSSAGILEAPTLGLPTINIGKRQRGREHADNVIFTEYDPEEIQRALDKVMNDSVFRAQVAKRETPYGDGTTSARIAQILSQTNIDARLMHKRFILET